MGGQSYDTTSRLDGKQVASFAVMPTTTANALETATAVRAKMDELSKYFPPGVKHAVPYDTSKFVKISIHEVVKMLIEAVILVFLVMYLFLQNIRLHDYSDGGGAGRADGHVCSDERDGLFDQRADDVRHGAGDWHSG